MIVVLAVYILGQGAGSREQGAGRKIQDKSTEDTSG